MLVYNYCIYYGEIIFCLDKLVNVCILHSSFAVVRKKLFVTFPRQRPSCKTIDFRREILISDGKI